MSTIKTDNLQNAAGTLSVPVATVVNGSAKAWVNFNGTGTVAIRAAFNVSSITDNGTGDYTLNFTTAMPDANYAVTSATQVTGTVDVGTCSYHPSASPSTSSVRLLVSNRLSAADNPIVAIAIFR